MSDAIDAYRGRIPEQQWVAIKDFVSDCVRDLDPATAVRTTFWMTTVTRLVAWCWQRGYALDREIVFRREIIADYVTFGLAHATTKTQAAIRSSLFTASATLMTGPRKHVYVRPLDKGFAQAPYTEDEQIDIEQWADQQTTDYRRISATMMIALCLGAGLSHREMCGVRAKHVHRDSDGVLIEVTESERPRMVPVTQHWERPLVTIGDAAIRPDQFLFLPRRYVEYHGNLSSTFVGKTKPPFPISATRLRSTWIVRQLAAGTPITAVHEAAGFTHYTALTLYLPHVPAIDPVAARHALWKAHPYRPQS